MSPLSRLLVALVVVVILLVGGLALFWYLAYGVDEGPPERHRTAAVAAPVEIGWGDEGEVTIEAQSEADAWAALGYVHGRQRAWSVALWRQAALGRLGAWFGEAAHAVDALALQLGLARQARASFATLTDEEKALLEAYAAGLNTAFDDPTQRLQQELVLLDAAPERWEAWHPLAIERLFAWLAVPPDPQPRYDAATRAFFEADETLRAWLALHGFDNSVAWAVRDSAGTHFFQRHVYGATALPFLLEVGIEIAGAPAVWGASLPGTPFLPAGKTETHAWALLLAGSARLDRAPWDSAGTQRVFEQLRYRDGTEQLVASWRHPAFLPLTASDGPADSVWVLRWAGLGTASDLGAWRSLAAGTPAAFTLLGGHGLRIAREGGWQVLGQPTVDEVLPDGRFVGMSPWARYAAELLGTQEPGEVPFEAWIDDIYSTWAAQTAPPLIEAAAAEAPADSALGEALTYLRNWDFGYDRASIAASIFDTWMAFYRDTTGTLPVPAAQDSLPPARRLLRATLTRALDHLDARFGPDLSQWRWEHVHPSWRLFPIWSADSLQAAGVPGLRRYEPIEFPGEGHPSSLAWSPSPVQRRLPAPATWEAWVHTSDWAGLFVRYPRFDANAPLGRYLISDRPPSPLRLPAAAPDASTRLLPADR